MSTAAPVGLPLGFGLAIDPDTVVVDDRTLVGGVPTRVMRLAEPGITAWRALQGGSVDTPAAAVLARRLTDAGLAHPRPSTPGRARAVAATVVVPVRDRTALLDRCLTGIAGTHPVVVVDDGSTDPAAVAAVVTRHGARLVQRRSCGGPAAARNTGLEHADSDLIAFLDSDCAPPSGWLERLARHLDDPLVGAVAPRVVTTGPDTPAGRYGALFGSLDLGARESLVGPGARVGYVPSAALLVRRTALLDVSRNGLVFDPALRYGEDVDLVWRLNRAGWRIRYEPSVEVGHREPDTWHWVMARRFHYGTSAAPLAVRHPGALAPLVLRPWPSAVVAAGLARRPALAAACLTGTGVVTARSLRRAGLPAATALTASAGAVCQTWLGAGRYLCQFASPVLAAGLLLPGRRRWSRRAALLSLLIAPALSPAAGPSAGQGLDPVAIGPLRRVLARLADDVCYGAGVYVGCARTRILTPLVPRVVGAGGALTRPGNCRDRANEAGFPGAEFP